MSSNSVSSVLKIEADSLDPTLLSRDLDCCAATPLNRSCLSCLLPSSPYPFHWGSALTLSLVKGTVTSVLPVLGIKSQTSSSPVKVSHGSLLSSSSAVIWLLGCYFPSCFTGHSWAAPLCFSLLIFSPAVGEPKALSETCSLPPTPVSMCAHLCFYLPLSWLHIHSCSGGAS